MVDNVIAPYSVGVESADAAPTSGTPQYFTDGDPNASIGATAFPAYFANMLQSELRSIVVAAGITPSGADWGQVWQGILGSHTFLDGGEPNAIYIVPPLTVENLVAGMEITVVIAANNTGGSATLEISGITKPITRPNLSTMQANDLIAGQPRRFHYDGTQWRLFLVPYANVANLNSPLIGDPSGLLSEVLVGTGLAMDGNTLVCTV